MTAKSRFLLVTQNPQVRTDVTGALRTRQREIVDVRDGDHLSALLDRGAKLVLVDLRLPERTIADLAQTLALKREVPIIVLADDNAASWYKASRGSPLERVLEGPFNAEELNQVARDLVERSRFLHEKLVGQSETIQQLREEILLVAPTPVTVLVTGESGSGKDVVAQALHHYSDRAKGSFKAVNCAAIPENLLENELFGHEKGAFTDAHSQFRGIFEQADGGTVFLDEIGEMALSAQVRLLRVLEERKVTRVGGDTALNVDVRVLAASNRDLLEAVSAGEFRRDLYYRLKVVELHLPPLRERRDDIPPLLDHYIEQLKESAPSAQFAGLSPAGLDLLNNYDWPGNVRELRNLVERLVFLGPRGQVQPQDLIPHLEGAPATVRHLPVVTGKTPDQSERELIYFALLDLKREVAELRRVVEGGASDHSEGSFPPRPVYHVGHEMDLTRSGSIDSQQVIPAAPVEASGLPSLKEMEREAIERALVQVGQNRRKAAQLLGIGVRTLYRKLDEYDLK
jgi:DNA-binding NtrC family response regulator